MSNNEQSVLVGSIQKFSVEDGPGIRTTIFLKGCSLDCKWCHNPELISFKQELIRSPNNCIGCGYCIDVCPQHALTTDSINGIAVDRDKCDVCLKCADNCYAQALRPVAKSMTVAEIMDIAEQDKGFYDNTGGGITVSGGEVLMHAGAVAEIIREAARRGINACVDTSGYGDPQALKELALMNNVTDILYDMKSIDEKVHREYAGVENALILDNLRMLAEDERTAGKINMRMPLIKGVNDTEDIIERTGNLYSSLGIKRVNLLPYHNLGISKKRNVGGIQEEFEAPSEERLTEIEQFFKGLGMEVSILGRV